MQTKKKYSHDEQDREALFCLFISCFGFYSISIFFSARYTVHFYYNTLVYTLKSLKYLIDPNIVASHYTLIITVLNFGLNKTIDKNCKEIFLVVIDIKSFRTKKLLLPLKFSFELHAQYVRLY